jgi:toxin FitB
VITLGEIRKGFMLQQNPTRLSFLNKWFHTDLLPWFAGQIIPVTQTIAERWGMLDGECQIKGTPPNTADGLIAATALEYDLTLVTRNVKDFVNLGINFLDPWDAQELNGQVFAEKQNPATCQSIGCWVGGN